MMSMSCLAIQLRLSRSNRTCVACLALVFQIIGAGVTFGQQPAVNRGPMAGATASRQKLLEEQARLCGTVAGLVGKQEWQKALPAAERLLAVRNELDGDSCLSYADAL